MMISNSLIKIVNLGLNFKQLNSLIIIMKKLQAGKYFYEHFVNSFFTNKFKILIELKICFVI